MLSPTMEVACSFDEFAQVLAEDGYINAGTYFNDANNLPSMLRVFESKEILDSPESFPESPCSDEDIAKVLEITQMASPSLLESCIPDDISTLSTSQNSVLGHSHANMTKTIDPCITNAVLHDVFRNTSTANYPSRPTGFLDGLCLPSNLFNNSISVNLNHALDSKENDAINTSLFDSTPVLSPLSDVDHIQHPLSNFHEQTHQTNTSFVKSNVGNNAIEETFAAVLGTLDSDGANDESKSSEPQSSSSTQKRKRKRTSYSKSTKSRKNKNKNGNAIPKQQPKAKKAKMVDDNSTVKQTNKQSRKKRSEQTTAPEVSSEEKDCASNGKTVESNDDATSKQKEEPALRRSSRSTRNTENYNFRISSLVKRVETERRQQEPKQPKGKAKPPPLSKYRRRTANARERDRMKEINDAFDVLKDALPAVEEENKHKVTKFTILNLALNYISALKDMLGYPEIVSNSEGSSLIDCSSDSLDKEEPSNSVSSKNSPQEFNETIVQSPINTEWSPTSMSISKNQEDYNISSDSNSSEIPNSNL